MVWRKQGPKEGVGWLSKGATMAISYLPAYSLARLSLERVVDEEGDGESVSWAMILNKKQMVKDLQDWLREAEG